MIVVVKFVYKHIYLPLRMRAKYSKYENVLMSEKFVPLLGDLSIVIQNEKDGKSKFHHNIEDSLQNKGYDIQLSIMSSFVLFDL